MISINNDSPRVVVVDNFLKNPNELRNRALLLKDTYKQRGSAGVRTEPQKWGIEFKPHFEKLLNKKITTFNLSEEGGGTNCCFQWCDQYTEQVIHADECNSAGVLYLTPNAPASSGTDFYVHRKTGYTSIKNLGKEAVDKLFETGWQDFTPWEKIDSVSNVYNRLILFDGRYFHSAAPYFGDSIENGRLFMVFFFSVEENNEW